MQLITVTRVDVKLKNNSSRSSGLIDKMRFAVLLIKCDFFYMLKFKLSFVPVLPFSLSIKVSRIHDSYDYVKTTPSADV